MRRTRTAADRAERWILWDGSWQPPFSEDHISSRRPEGRPTTGGAGHTIAAMRRKTAALALFLLVAPVVVRFAASSRSDAEARCALACARAGMGVEKAA